MKSNSRSKIHETSSMRRTGLKQRLRQTHEQGNLSSNQAGQIAGTTAFTPTNPQKQLDSAANNRQIVDKSKMTALASQVKNLDITSIDPKQPQQRTRSQQAPRTFKYGQNARMAVEEVLSDRTVDAKEASANKPDGAWFSRQQSSAEVDQDAPAAVSNSAQKKRSNPSTRIKSGKKLKPNSIEIVNLENTAVDAEKDRKEALYRSYIQELRDASRNKVNHRSQLVAQSFSYGGLNSSRHLNSQYDGQSAHKRQIMNRTRIMRQIVREKRQEHASRPELTSKSMNKTAGQVWDSSNINYESMSENEDGQYPKDKGYCYDDISAQEGSFSDSAQDNELVDEMVSEINKSVNGHSPHMIAQFFTSQAHQNKNILINDLKKDSSDQSEQELLTRRQQQSQVQPFMAVADQSSRLIDQQDKSRYFKSRNRTKSSDRKNQQQKAVYLYDYEYTAAKQKAISQIIGKDDKGIGGKVTKDSFRRVEHPLVASTQTGPTEPSNVEANSQSTTSNEDDEIIVEDAFKGHSRVSIFKAGEMVNAFNMKRAQRQQKAREILQQEKEYFATLHSKQRTFSRDNTGKVKYNDYSDYYDPVDYLKRKCIVARKYHYSVPTTYSDSNVLLSYEQSSDSLRVFDLDKGTPSTVKANLIELDKLVMQVPMSKIKGFIYGSFSTRFWMLRIGMNQLILDNSPYAAVKRQKIQEHRAAQEKAKEERVKKRRMNTGKEDDSSSDQDSICSQPNEYQIAKKAGTHDAQHQQADKQYESTIESKIPFYAWECISLQMEDRDLDLVIRSEKLMKIFILFLIVKLNTHNGIANSLDPMRDRGLIRSDATSKQMMQAIYKNFFIMKVRMKISYEACHQCRTIQELFFLSILKAYSERNRLGLVAKPHPRVTRKMVLGIKNMCLSGMTKMNVMMQEAKIMRHDSLRQRGLATKTTQRASSLEVTTPLTPELMETAGFSLENLTTEQRETLERYNKAARQKHMFNALTASVTNQDGVEDLFAKFYQSDHEDVSVDNEHLAVDAQNLLENYSSLNVKRTRKKGNIAKLLMIDKDKNYDDVTLRWKKELKVLQMRKRMVRTEKEASLQKLQLLLKLRLIKGPLYIYAMLEVIKLSKAVLVLELERGMESPVPMPLGQKHLPRSFQYYDCIMEIVRQNVHENQKLVLYNDHLVARRQHADGCFSGKVVSKLEEPLAVDDPKLAAKNCSSYKYKNKGFDKTCQPEIPEEPDKQWFKGLFKNMMCIRATDEDKQRQRETQLKMKLYERAQSVQAARYLQLEKDKMRLVYNVSDNYQSNDGIETDRQVVASKDVRQRNFSLQHMNFADVISLEKACEDEKLQRQVEQMLTDEHLQVSSRYLTHWHVGKKRGALLKKKIHYQNQLTSLKEKGKRLLKSSKLDVEIENAVQQLLDQMNNWNADHEGDDEAILPPEYVLLRVRELQRLLDTFTASSLKISEVQINNNRVNLLRKIKSHRTFDQQQQFVDKKIAYDQRFFNASYPEFQLMISDIRKMCRLNEQVTELRRQLMMECAKHENAACNHQHEDDQFEHGDKPKLKRLATDLQEKKKELVQARVDSDILANQIMRTRTIQDEAKREARLMTGQTSKATSEKVEISYEEIIVESDDEAHNQQPGAHSFMKNDENMGIKSEKSLESNKLFKTLREKAKKASALGTPKLNQRKRSHTVSVGQQQLNLFERLARVVGQVSTDEDLFNRLSLLSGKMQRCREKMANVSRVSQNCLWAVDHDAQSGSGIASSETATKSHIWGNIRNSLIQKVSQSQVMTNGKQHQPMAMDFMRDPERHVIVEEELVDESFKTSRSLAN